VGFEKVKLLSSSGELFTIFLVLAGVGTAGYIFQTGQLLLEEEKTSLSYTGMPQKKRFWNGPGPTTPGAWPPCWKPHPRIAHWGKTLPSANVRQRAGAMGIGVVRENPDPHMPLQAGDTLWVMGSVEAP